jgi:uncharacterized protein YegJ (DUF2314 family)
MKAIRQFLFVLLLASTTLFLMSCGKSTASKDDPTVSVSANDPEMNAAIDKARNTVQQFIDALKSPLPSQSDFFIKKPFTQGETVEHIWLMNVTFDGKDFHGKISNDPEEISGIKYGDDAVVGVNEISDWMYVQDGKLVGGYTFRVLFSRMTPEEKTNFLKQAAFKIE